VVIGPLAAGEHDSLFTLFAEIVDSGAGYPHAPPLTRGMFDATWVTSVTLAVVARSRRRGRRRLLPEAQLSRAGPPTSPTPATSSTLDRRGGIGRLLVEDSLWRAPLLGFDAIQFNLVFAGNPARSLYEELGWREIGRLPDAVDGEDAIIYWRRVG
jgi:GNAT superfamily N-acetyltransferase